MVRRLVLAAVAALFLVSCAKDSELTVVAATVKFLDKPDAAGATLGESGLGARLKGRRSRKGWWKIQLPDGKEGFAPRETIAPYPIAGQPRWVVAPFAGQLAEPDLASRTITAKYEIGTQLEIVGGAPWLPPEIAAVIGTGTVIGFVPVRTLGDREPKAADLLAAGREALLAGKTSEALMQGRRALSLDPKHAGARSLVAALHRANGDPEAEAMEDALVIPETAPPAVTVKPGDEVFVGVASLALRKGRGETTELLTRLPINTPVTVKAIDGAWAKVAWKGQPDVGANIDIDPFGVAWALEAAARPRPTPVPVASPAAIASPAAAASPDAAASPAATPEATQAAAAATPVLEEVVVDEDEVTIGWLLGGHLDAAPQSADALAAVARQRAAEGKAVEAVGLFESAATLAPSNLELTRELLATAVKADRYLTAAYAALALGRGGDDLDGLEVVRMDLFYGCRGNRHEAEHVSGGSAPEADEELPDNACVSDVNSEPLCDPCEYGDEDGYVDGGHDHSDYVEPEETPELSAEEAERRRAIEDAEAAAVAAQQAVEQADRDAQNEREQRERDVAIADHDLYLTKIDTAYSGGAWVYLEIRNRRAGRMAGAKIQLYELIVSNAYGETDYESDSVRVSEVELPPLGPNASVGLWYRVWEYAGREYGVVRLASEEAANEALVKFAQDQHGNIAMPPHHSVLIEKPDCSCGGGGQGC